MNVRIALVVSHREAGVRRVVCRLRRRRRRRVADDERYTHVDQMQLDRDRFRRRIHQSELILAQ